MIIPDKWDTRTIESVYDFTKKPKEISYADYDQIPFVPMEIVPIGRSHIDSFIFKPSSSLKSGTYFEKGDILLAKITPSFENGKQGIAKELPNSFGVASTELIPIREKKDISNKYFLFYYLLDGEVRKQLAVKMEGTTGRQRLPLSVLKKWVIPFPPLSQQQKIASVLFKIQKAIETQERIIETTRELKKSTMQHVFTYGLRGEKTKETEILRIPGSWEIVKLGKYTSVVTKGSSPRWQGFEYCKEGVLFIRSQNVGDGCLLLNNLVYLPLAFNEKEKRSIIKNGDILINLVGASIGRLAIADDSLDGSNTNQAVAIVRLDNSNLLNWFVMYFLMTDRGQEEINFNKKEIARANISLTDIKNFIVPMPLIDEQKEIIHILKKIDQKIELHTAKKSALQDLFKTMLNKLMTGAIRVKDLDIEVDDKLFIRKEM